MRDFRTLYKGLFSAEPLEYSKANEAWSTLVKKVGEWLFDEYRDLRCNRTGIIKPWIFLGGYWDSGLQNVSAETWVLRTGQPDGQPPKYWTFRLEQRDARHRERVWRTDIGITLAEAETPRYDIAVTLAYYTLQTHVGAESPEPEAESPAVLDKIFEGENYKITLGGLRLRPRAKKMVFGDGKDLVKLLENPQRIFPIVLVRPDEQNHFQIHPDELQTLLLGNANVYFFGGDGVDQEMAHFIGFNHSIFRGVRNGIRVYQPMIDFSNPDDNARHRYFLLKDMDTVAIREVERYIFRGVQRRWRLPFRDFVSFREELYRKEKEFRLKQLREDRTAENDAEYIQLLEEELTVIEMKNSTATQNLEKASDELFAAEVKIEDLQKQLRQLNFERKQLETLTSESERQIADFQKQVQTVRKFSKLPANLAEVLEKIESLHPQRIYLLPEAKTSAAKANFDDLNAAWAALWNMAEMLWAMYFLENANTGTINQEFQNRTGIELSLGESKMTRESHDLMSQRTRRYRGREIDISPHLKINKGGKFLRIHFFADREHRLLVIGHCGDHLGTFSVPRPGA